MRKQTKFKDPQQISFIGKILVTRGATMFFIIEKSDKTTETQKIASLLNGSENEYTKFATRKWYVIERESKGKYSHHDPIKFLTNSIESSLCDYSDAYILVTENIAVTRTTAGNAVQRKQQLDAFSIDKLCTI